MMDDLPNESDASKPPSVQPLPVGRFVAIECGDASIPYSDGLGHVTVVSAALGSGGRLGRGDVTYWVPRACEGKSNLPVVVLLHGVYCSHWAWSNKASAHRTAQALIDDGSIGPCVIAMPSDGLVGEGSGYVNHPDGPQCADWIAEDVYDAMIEVVPQVSQASLFCIAGLSMGGFGAMRLGAMRPDRFTAFSGMSSLTHLKQMAWCTHEAKSFTDLPEPEASLLASLKLHAGKFGPFRFDCGADDFLIHENRSLHQSLLDVGIEHTYQEFPGEHTWAYWQGHLADTLRFFDRQTRAE